MAFVAPLAASVGSFLGSATGIMTAASTGLSVVSAISAGQYQAGVAKNNAAIAEQNARAEAAAMQERQARSDREYAALLGEQTATQAASGLNVMGRSQLQTGDVTQRVARQAAHDINTAGTNTARRFLQDAANFRAEASQAKTQGWLSAAGALADFGMKAANYKPGPKSLLGTTKKYPWDKKSPAPWYVRT